MDNFNGEGWWTGFMRRHPVLSLWCSESLVKSLFQCCYHWKLEKNFSCWIWSTPPDNFYYIIEMPLDPKQLKHVASRGMRKVHGQASGDICAVSDYCSCMWKYSWAKFSPMVKGEQFNGHRAKCQTHYKTWVRVVGLFYYWLFYHIFHLSILSCYCMCDSYFTLEAIAWATEKCVVVFHQTQPMFTTFRCEFLCSP